MILMLAIGWSPHALAQKTKTSTATKLPHEGGPLPRAPMPQGGVDDGMKRSGSEGGVDHGGMKRVGQVGGAAKIGEHCHEHEHEDGSTHSHCHDHAKGPEHEHAHEEGDHCHEHEHEGSRHSHCHDDAHHGSHEKPDEEASLDEEHCHQHAHEDGTVHSHCHQETGDPKHTHEHTTPPGEPPWELSYKTKFGLVLAWEGYIRFIAEVIENDPNSAFIGRNDGFRLANARLGTRASYGDLFLYVSIEAAVGESETFNDPNQEFTVRPRDAYMRYDFSDYAGVQVGRFRAPYDLGSLLSPSDIGSNANIFIDAPLESRGVLPTQGNELIGMSQDRQLGIMISKDRVGITENGFDLGYALALTNGRTFNLALNDNDRPAGFARLRLYWGEWVELNLGGFTDPRTVGELPNLFDEDVLGGEVSMILTFFGLRLEGQFLVQNTEFDTAERPDVLAYGAHGQFDYSIWDFRFGYRFAWYEPNVDDLDDADQIMEHTVALQYVVPSLPLKFAIAGTFPLEQEGRRVKNTRGTLLAQFKF
jgi:hypothetical protein